MDSIVAGSPLFDETPPEFPATVDDVIMGEKLGEGGFCVVHACGLKDSPHDESCAIKYLKPQTTVSQKVFEHGAADLATEAYFLAKLDREFFCLFIRFALLFC
jgi:hypothetical protein